MDKKRKITSISVISSSVCNLKCSFCYLHKNQSYKIYDKIIQQAWKDKTYVPNIIRTLEAINANNKDVDTIQLWGGETLLSIKNVIPNVEDFYKAFPNICVWRISSNWMINVKDFFDFVKEINDRTIKFTEIKLQLSIDGPPGPIHDDGHKGNWDIYRKNIEEFCNLVNNTKLSKIKVTFVINATVSKELYLKEFSTYEGIKNYVQYMKDFVLFIDEHCISSSLGIVPRAIFPGLALPYDSTVEEGLEFAKISRLWEYVRANEFPDEPHSYAFHYGIGQLNSDVLIYGDNLECSELNNSLTILHDGTICECNGSFMSADPNYQKELLDNKEYDAYRVAKITSHTTQNPGLMTPEELEIYNWAVVEGYKNNSSTYMNYMMAACDELALSGQIPYKYHLDKDLCYRHVKTLSGLISCSRENNTQTKVSFLTNPSAFRRYMNGLMEYSYDDFIINEKNGVK